MRSTFPRVQYKAYSAISWPQMPQSSSACFVRFTSIAINEDINKRKGHSVWTKSNVHVSVKIAANHFIHLWHKLTKHGCDNVSISYSCIQEFSRSTLRRLWVPQLYPAQTDTPISVEWLSRSLRMPSRTAFCIRRFCYSFSRMNSFQIILDDIFTTAPVLY